MVLSQNIPKTIYTLWYQGEDQAPPIVRFCFKRWRNLNPDYEFCVLNSEDVSKKLKNFPISISQISLQALSDVVRADLLLRNGGIWVDATVLPILPLSEWLPEVDGEGFFAFEKPAPDRPLASWFIAANQQHTVMQKWWDEIERYWHKPRCLMMDPRQGNPIPDNPIWEVSPDGGSLNAEYPYFWFHYLFSRIIETDAEVAAIWECCPKKSADLPHKLQAYFATNNYPTMKEAHQIARCAPVQKLDWRTDYPIELLQVP